MRSNTRHTEISSIVFWKLLKENTILTWFMKIGTTSRRPGRSLKILSTKISWENTSLNLNWVMDQLHATNQLLVKNTGIGPSIAKKIPKQTLSPLNYLGNPIIQSIFLSEVTTNEIDKIIQSLKNGAAGHDDITAAANLKLVARSINQPLAYLCNLSFTQGVFPKELKLAYVLPLYKSEDPYSFNNYRPVSLLCVLSKVFEKVMYDRLLEFLEIHKLLFAGQFGFRKQHSSYMALMIFIDKLISSLDKGEMVIGIFLDFSKAFDTVDHEILL